MADERVDQATDMPKSGSASDEMPKASERKKARWARYRAKHREELNARARAEYQTNPAVAAKAKAACALSYAKHREKRTAVARAKYHANPEKERERRQAAMEKDPERVRAYWRKYEAANKEKCREKVRRYDRENADKRKAYREAHKDEFAARSAAHEKANHHRRRSRHDERQAVDPEYRIRRALRSRFKQAMRSNYKSTSAVHDLGCTIAELRIHLERKFMPGMDWENYGEWHIDHIRDLVLFDLIDPQQARLASHYTNLQPLWRFENISKGSRARWGRRPNAQLSAD